MQGVALATCAFAASLTCASASFAGGTDIRGTFVSASIDARGSSLTMAVANGRRTMRLAAHAAIEEGFAGAWRPISIVALKPAQPLDVSIDAAGTATRVRAAYGAVTTRLVVVDQGYLVGSDGNAYKLVGEAVAQAARLSLGMYLVLRVDPNTGNAFDLVASRTPLTAEGAPARKVTVTFVVRVPPNTPGTDAVYMATSAGNWTPNAIRMSPLPGNRWSASLQLTGGTRVTYKYTRGSWPTDERNAAGTEISNRSLSVTSSADAQTVYDVVARWADLPS